MFELARNHSNLDVLISHHHEVISYVNPLAILFHRKNNKEVCFLASPNANIPRSKSSIDGRLEKGIFL